MKTVKPILKTFFVGLFLFTAAGAMGAERAASAKVQSVKGLVRYQVGQTEWKELKSGQVLPVNSTIKTGLESEAILLLTLPYAATDRSAATSMVRIVDSSEVTLDKLSVNTVGSTGKADVNLKLKEGQVHVRTSKLAPSSDFKITTPYSVATFRGTEAYVRSNGSVYVKEGSVDVTVNVTSPTGAVTTRIIRVEAGQVLLLPPSGSNLTVDEFNALAPQTATEDLLRAFGDLSTRSNDLISVDGVGNLNIDRPDIQLISQ